MLCNMPHHVCCLWCCSGFTYVNQCVGWNDHVKSATSLYLQNVISHACHPQPTCMLHHATVGSQHQQPMKDEMLYSMLWRENAIRIAALGLCSDTSAHTRCSSRCAHGACAPGPKLHTIVRYLGLIHKFLICPAGHSGHEPTMHPRGRGIETLGVL